MSTPFHSTSMRLSLAILSAAALCSQPAAAQEQGESKSLLPIVMAAITPALQSGFGCVFDRLLSFLGANPTPACIQPNNTTMMYPGGFVQGGYGQPAYPQQAGAAVQTGAYQPSAAYIQPSAAMPGAMPAVGAQPGQLSNVQALQLARTPLLSFIVNKLTDGSPQARVRETVMFDKVQQGSPNLAFDIKTGESFAILFASTVPGRVRMINTDVDRVVSTSDLYETLPGADNRMPRDWQGGITMSGKKGIEYLDIDFTPCISQQYAGDARVAPFVGILPACAPESATKRYTPAAASGKGGVLEGGAKAMVFPASANPGQPVAFAPPDYAKGGTLTFRITINHQ